MRLPFSEKNHACLRPTVKLNSTLDQRLIAYIAAATAGFAASAAPVEASIVYTPTNTNIQPNSRLDIDLNNDGTADFVVFRCGCLAHGSGLWVSPVGAGNGIRLANAPFSEAAANFFGVPLGPGEKFGPAIYYYPGLFMMSAQAYGDTYGANGPWANVTNRYLGFKFLVDGEVHYGWARLTVGPILGGVVTLTGYAYETIPRRGIRVGDVGRRIAGVEPKEVELKENASVTAPRQSLGALAWGADGLAIWRRDEEVVSSTPAS